MPELFIEALKTREEKATILEVEELCKMRKSSLAQTTVYCNLGPIYKISTL